jgi:hypothetical protein
MFDYHDIDRCTLVFNVKIIDTTVLYVSIDSLMYYLISLSM